MDIRFFTGILLCAQVILAGCATSDHVPIANQRLTGAAANIPILINEDALKEVDRAGNAHTLLKVTLLKVHFRGSGQKHDPICLRMQTKAKKFDAATNQQLDAMAMEYQGTCLSLDDWVKHDDRKIGQCIDTGYEMLSEEVVDWLYGKDPARTFKRKARASCSNAYYFHAKDGARALRKEAGAYCPNADLDHADAQRHIGDLYYNGFPPRQEDPKEACVWYRLSASGDDVDAEFLLEQVTSELTTNQLSDVKHRLDLWEPGHCMTDLLETASLKFDE